MFEVTATRRRPQQLSDLVGQEFVAETLKNSISSNQIAHAYLFSGPRGCGKTSTARIIAKALNCEKGPSANPCGECANCIEITKGSNLDVIEIDGASNTSVNDVRQIKDEVLFPPNSARYKIYIIDEVHMLSTNAFNALLKTIEEPPPYVIFIFATTELQKVPATIKSRCQQFNFRLVPIDKIKNLLADATKELSIEAEDEALYWIAREATGSIRDAYTLFDQVASFSGGNITYDKIRNKLGLLGVDKLNDIFEKCAIGKSEEVLSILDEYLQSGISIEQLISNSTNYIRSLLLIKNGISNEGLLGNVVERYSSTVLQSWTVIQIERALSIFLQLFRDIRYSLSPRYELELSFSRLCWLSEYVSPSEVKSAIEAARSLLVNQVPIATEQTKVQAEGNSSNLQNVPRFAALAEESSNKQKEAERPFCDGGQLENPPNQSGKNITQSDNSIESEENVILYNAEIEDTEQDKTFTTGSGRKITITQLRGSIIAELGTFNALAAGLLMATKIWKITEKSITVVADTNYQKTQLEKNIDSISKTISKVCECDMSFIIETNSQEGEDGESFELPPEVKILCNVFKGNIVGGATK